MNTDGNNINSWQLVKLANSAGRICFLLACALIVVGCSAVVQAEPLATTVPESGTASSLVALSSTAKPGEAVICTTSTVIQTLCSVTDTIKEGDAPTTASYNASLKAYDALAPVACTKVLTGTLADMTLAPGVYCFDSTATLTGKLTLNGPMDGIWIFKIGTNGVGALIGTNFSVVMSGGGQPCNVSWRVADDVTLTDSNFVGTILAGSACTITRGTFFGDAFSKDITKAVRLTDVRVTTCKTINASDDKSKIDCNQGVGNGPEGCDPGNSNQGDPSRSNDEIDGEPGDPGRKDGNVK